MKGRAALGKRRSVAALAVLNAALAGLVALMFAWPTVVQQRMLVIAHRGVLSEGPENSLPALAAVRASGADGLEFDVNRSADGTWWVTHDDELSARTTGHGSPWSLTDAEFETLTIDGGMGFDPARHAGMLPVLRLTEVLQVFDGYRGLLIVDCKDTRPGAAAALATALTGSGLNLAIIARSVLAASEVKGVDRRITTITQQIATWDPDVDIWLGNSKYLRVGETSVADLFGEVGMFMGQDLWPGDERPLLEAGRGRGVSFVITNDVSAALAWRDRAGEAMGNRQDQGD